MKTVKKEMGNGVTAKSGITGVKEAAMPKIDKVEGTKEVKPITEKVIKPEIKKINYLRDKYCKLSPSELNGKINVRGINENARIAKVVKDADDAKKAAVVTKVTGDSEIRLSPKSKKYVSDSFEGNGKEVQDNFIKYLRKNVWGDETLSNVDKLKIMKEYFKKLTINQKKILML